MLVDEEYVCLEGNMRLGNFSCNGAHHDLLASGESDALVAPTERGGFRVEDFVHFLWSFCGVAGIIQVNA